MKEGISYRIFGGLKFYDRKEIKDVIAYLRVIENPSDDISLKRIINEPKRGIGAVTVGTAEDLANQRGEHIYPDFIRKRISRAPKSQARN